MTRMSLQARPCCGSWLAAGLIAVSLGIVALVASVPLTALRDAGWPWLTTMSVQVSPPSAKATIVEDDGTVHQFTGLPSEAEAWQLNKEHELKSAHGIYTKIAVGQALNWVGWALLALGGAVLLWRWLAARLERRRGRAVSPLSDRASVLVLQNVWPLTYTQATGQDETHE